MCRNHACLNCIMNMQYKKCFRMYSMYSIVDIYYILYEIVSYHNFLSIFWRSPLAWYLRQWLNVIWFLWFVAYQHEHKADLDILQRKRLSTCFHWRWYASLYRLLLKFELHANQKMKSEKLIFSFCSMFRFYDEGYLSPKFICL